MNLQPTKINTFLLSIVYSNSNLAIQVTNNDYYL